MIKNPMKKKLAVFNQKNSYFLDDMKIISHQDMIFLIKFQISIKDMKNRIKNSS